MNDIASVDATTESLRRLPLIKAERLSKVYTSRKSPPVNALNDLTFDIGEGEFLSIVGRSGCGKSTLLRIIAGLEPYSSGSLSIRGRDVQGATDGAAIVFQSPVLLPWRTIIENVLIPLEFQNRRTSDSAARAHEILKTVGLEGFAHYKPYELSGGMQQRAAIARALIQEPALLLMDEPFGALDAMSRELMNLELLRIWSETRQTVVFITHSVAEALFLSDRVFALSERPGRLAEVITVDLPRPRTLEMINTPQFGEYAAQLRSRLNATGAMF
jgi:NitT/TauT family transport system ATP-binding protein